MRRLGLGLGLVTLLAAGAAFAADVKIAGVHNCCPGCANGIRATLEGAGATNITLNGREVGFSAEEAQKVVQTFFDAGYAGKVTGAKTPEPQGVKGVKGATLKFSGVHLCCGACANAVNAALAPIGKSDAKARTETFTLTAAQEVEAAAVLKALRDAGFNARVAK